MITDNAEQILKERYYLKDSNGKPIENWEGLCTRVANSVALAEDNPDEWSGAFFDMIYELDFIPNSPCLMNAGKTNGQLAACFVLPIGDSMEEIFETIKNGALIHKTGGGTGYSFSNIRGKGEIVNSTQGVASGPISFMKAFDAATETVKQGGTRRGANMAVLLDSHPDILDFISCKDDSNSLNNFNISVAITDKFMVNVTNHLNLGGQTSEEKIFDKLVSQAHKNGEPGVIFIDAMNRANPTPHIGTFESTNPCVIGETLIQTVEGELPIRELVGKTIDVYCMGEKLNNVRIASATNIRCVKKNAKLVKVCTTWKDIVCTPEHKIYIDGKGWIEAQKLSTLDIIRIKSDKMELGDSFETSMIASVTHLDYSLNVYDMEVPGYHNYVANGIVIHNCGEQPLLPYEVCNLGSINLTNHLNSKNEIDWGHLEKTVKVAVRFLDDVIDISSYPLQEIEDMAKGNRKIGLGVMGFADILITMGIRYGCEDSIMLAEQIMESINSMAHNFSRELAVEKGSYPNLEEGSLKQRNATRTTIAPTGTISRIANCSSGIEPLFALSYTSKIMDIEQTYFNEALETKAEEYNWLIREEDGTLADISGIECLSEFVTSHDIKPEDHIRMQAAFQKYTDNAVSKTINMPNSATKEDVRKAFILAHELGCKGITIYRDGSREQVLNKPETKSHSKTCEPSTNRPDLLKGTTTRKPTSCGNVYVTINTKDGKPYEVISTMGKSGGCSASYIEALCRIISLGLKNGIPLSDMAGQLRGIRCPIPKLGKETILSCSDAISSVFFGHLGEKVPEVQSAADIGYNPQCPECGNQLVHAGGCVECSNKGCGYSRCA